MQYQLLVLLAHLLRPQYQTKLQLVEDPVVISGLTQRHGHTLPIMTTKLIEETRAKLMKDVVKMHGWRFTLSEGDMVDGWCNDNWQEARVVSTAEDNVGVSTVLWCSADSVVQLQNTVYTQRSITNEPRISEVFNCCCNGGSTRSALLSTWRT